MEDPAGVGAVRTCDTMRHHDGVIILPLAPLSCPVAAGLVLAIRGAIRITRVSEQMILRLSFNSESAEAITIGGSAAFRIAIQKKICGVFAPRYRYGGFFLDSKRAAQKNGRSHTNLAGTGHGPYGGKKPS